jgi:Transposase DDE domain
VFLKAVVIMIVRQLRSVHALVAVLEQPEMAAVRGALSEHRHVPTRRTFERRRRRVPGHRNTQIAVVGAYLLGAYLLGVLDPWAKGSRAVAIDSTPLRARGTVWHQKDRAVGRIPHTTIDTDAHWTHSGWHGWVYGYKLHLLVTVGQIWLPLAAELTPANVADNVQAVALLDALRQATLDVLGDVAYNDPALRTHCERQGRTLITTKRGPHPHTDAGVAVRRLFHQLRPHTVENFNGQFKGIFDCSQAVPTNGLIATQRQVLGAVLVYQVALLYRFQTGGDLRVGMKPLLQAA